MLWAGMSWVRSMIWACGLIPRITPFMLPTKTSAAPKSVSRVMMGGGTDSGLSGDRAMEGASCPRSRCCALRTPRLWPGFDLDGIPHALADEGAPDWRLDRDLAVFQIAFVRADECVALLCLSLHIFDRD